MLPNQLNSFMSGGLIAERISEELNLSKFQIMIIMVRKRKLENLSKNSEFQRLKQTGLSNCQIINALREM